jgi:hypothetical protein
MYRWLGTKLFNDSWNNSTPEEAPHDGQRDDVSNVVSVRQVLEGHPHHHIPSQRRATAVACSMTERAVIM